MTVIGPARLIINDTDYGDALGTIVQNPPAPVTFTGINRDHTETPDTGWGITLTAVQEDLTAGTLWRYLWDASATGTKNVPVLWSPLGAGDVWFLGIITSIPAPTTGGQARAHGTLDVTLPLAARPVIVPAPEED